MPLWWNQSNRIVEGSRSHNSLIKGMDHSTPPEEFVVDPTLPVLFSHEYGTVLPGLEEVVIPKGMMVALTGKTAKDTFTGRYLPEITIADGSNAVIGMAAYNFCATEDDRFKGNKPLVINDWYVELPYIPDEDDAANVKWGLVYGHDIKPGDWLKPGSGLNKGKLTLWRPNIVQTERVTFSTSTGETKATVYTKLPIKPGEPVSVSVVSGGSGSNVTAEAKAAFVVELSGLDPDTTYTADITYVSLVSDPIEQRVAQVLAVEADQEPWGWLRWVMWDEAAKMEDKINGEPSFYGKPGDVQYPWDPNAPGYGYDPKYRQGVWDLPYYHSPYKTPDNARGIPGLTDGSERSKKVWSTFFTVPAGSADGEEIQVQLAYRNIIPGSVEVFVGGQKVDTFTVDHGAGIVRYKVGAAFANQPSPIQGEVRYRAYFWGTPPGWDFVGSVGAVRVLLHL